MADRRILHLSTAGLASHAPGAAADATFPPDAAGHARFASYLAAHPATRFTLLVDLPDELFSTEILPPVRGRDRQRLLARRTERIGAGTPYVTCLSLGKARAAGPDETIVLAALTRPEHLRPWIDTLIETGAIVTGIHSIPFVGMALLANLPTTALSPTTPQLIASLGPAGLRVSCYTDGKLQFSRLTLAGADPWAACQLELQRTRQYLYAQRILSREAPPEIRVLAHPDHHAAIRSATADAIDCIDLAALARQCGAPPPVGSDSLLLYIHLLFRNPRLPAIDEPALAHTRQVIRIGQGAMLGTALAVGACITLGVANYTAGQQTDAENAQLQARISGAQRQLDEARAALPPTPHPPAAIHAAHATALKLHGAPRIEPRLNAVAQAFNRHPQIELDRLEWALSPTDPSPALNIRLHISLPAQGANTLAEAFATSLQAITQAAVTIEPTSPSAPSNSATDTSPRQARILRLDFASPP